MAILAATPCREGSNLLMDVVEEGIRRPPAMLFDGDGVNPV
jgi:hypothetical protein